MKIRKGFVSNSSSSSFVICKEYLTKEQIKKIEEWSEQMKMQYKYFAIDSVENYFYSNFHNFSYEWFNLVEELKIEENKIFYFGAD